MKTVKFFLLSTVIFLTVACQPQSGSAQVATSTSAPTEAPVFTATATLEPVATETSTLVPTEIPVFTATPTDLFFSLSSAEVTPGYLMEPVVGQIFEAAMQAEVEGGTITSYQVDGLAVFPNGEGTLIAEVTYCVQTNDPAAWLADGGTEQAEGWITDKCARFDLEITAETYALKKKRYCS